jgi:hypothetical protein
MPDPDPSAPTPTPTPTSPGGMKILHVDFADDRWWISGDFTGQSPATVSGLRLLTDFRLTPPTDNDKLKVAAGATVLNWIYAKKGPIWMSMLLDVDAAYETGKGATGTVKLNSGLWYQPHKSIRLNAGVSITGSYNTQTGFDGSFQMFDGSLQLTHPKQEVGAALHYSF